jgi:sec-independent protein translocase protein TatB
VFEGRFTEILIIFVLALVVLGPEKLPRVVAEVGRWVGRARAMARQFREQLEEEVRLEEVRKAQAARPPSGAGQPGASQQPMDVGEALNPTPPPASSTAHEESTQHSTSANAFTSTADFMNPPPIEGSPASSTPWHAESAETPAPAATPASSSPQPVPEGSVHS